MSTSESEVRFESGVILGYTTTCQFGPSTPTHHYSPSIALTFDNPPLVVAFWDRHSNTQSLGSKGARSMTCEYGR